MKTCKLWLLSVAVIFPLSLGAEAQKENSNQDEMKKLQGTWQVVKFIDHSEQAAPPEEIKDHTFEFQGDKMIQRKGKGGGRSVMYTLDPTKKPSWLDLDLGGSVAMGIYKVEGDELSICVVGGMRGGKATPRPTEFKANKNPPYTLFVLKKVKK